MRVSVTQFRPAWAPHTQVWGVHVPGEGLWSPYPSSRNRTWKWAKRRAKALEMSARMFNFLANYGDKE